MTTIFEDLFILALDEEEGDFVIKAAHTLEPALAGAILAELVLHRRVDLRDKRIVVEDQTPTEHPILDSILLEILETTKARKLKYWINTLVFNKIMEEIGHNLIDQGILVRKKKRLRLSNPHHENYNYKTSTKSILQERLRAIGLDGQEPKLAEMVLLAFLYHGGLLKLVFQHGERKTAQKSLEKWILGNEAGCPLGQTLESIVTTACEIGGKDG